jgi:two-component system response regulator
MVERTLVLVEDDPNDEALLVRALKRSLVLVRVVVIRDGVEALEWLYGKGSHSGRDETITPLLMVLDLRLPKLGGLEVLKAVRAHPVTRSLPVVVLTASDDGEDLVKGYELGANSFIRKPATPADLVTIAEQLSAYWLSLNQVAPARARAEAQR